MRSPVSADRRLAAAPSVLALVALTVAGCDARSYDATCVANETSTSVVGASCEASQVGLLACALPDQDTCTPLSSTVVECTTSTGDGGTGSPTWQSVYTCALGELCYFLQPFDGAPPVSNAIGCGVTSYPIAQAALPCSTAGSQACDFDGTSVLECDGTSWKVSTTCSGTSTCGGVAGADGGESACEPDSPYCVGCQ